MASDWRTGEWSDGGRWSNASASVLDGRAAVVPAEAGEPWENKLRVTVSDAINSWIQMVLDGGPPPPIGQPVTIRWYQRIMLPDTWNEDPLTHGIALGPSNGDQPWLNYWTSTDGTYRIELQMGDDFDPVLSLPEGALAKRQWHRIEWTVTQVSVDRVSAGFHIYDLQGNQLYGSDDFTDWPWADGTTTLAERSWSFDIRAEQTKFVGWNSGLSGLDREVIWAEYAAVAMVLGETVGPFDPGRGY